MKDRKYNKISAVITLPYAAIKELKNIPYPFKVGERLIYEPKEGEKIDVCLWIVYPSYDFIFGIPAKDNPYKKEEAGFFQARDRDNKKVIKGFYLSEEELKEIIQGFKKIYEIHIKSKTKIQCIEEKYGKDMGNSNHKNILKYLLKVGYSNLAKLLKERKHNGKSNKSNNKMDRG